MKIMHVNRYKQWGIDDEDSIRQDPKAWWTYNQSGISITKLRIAHQEIAVKLASWMIDHPQFVSEYQRIMEHYAHHQH